MSRQALVLIVVLLLGPAHANAPTQSLGELTTVEKVDLNRYIGKWHEIALFPNRFQAQCVGDTTAT
jgi:apolipoprotein D and lipocalin family protein